MTNDKVIALSNGKTLPVITTLTKHRTQAAAVAK